MRLPIIPFFTLMLAASGCCHLRQHPHPRAARAVPTQALAEVSYSKPAHLDCTESNLQTTARFSLQRITMTVASGVPLTNRTIALDYFRPPGDGARAVILILPILGGDYPLEHHFARYFVRHGYAAVLLRREKIPKTALLEELNAMLRQSIIDARQALDWIESRPELDARRIGLFGISMGAIRGALLVPLDPRIRAATLGMPGGDLPWIISQSREPGLMKRREALLKEEGITETQFAERLRLVMTLDPLAVAPAVDPGKVLLVLAACDTNVPFKKGWELRKAMGKPETVLLPTGHYTALFYVPYIKLACRRFFDEKLDVAASRPSTR